MHTHQQTSAPVAAEPNALSCLSVAVCQWLSERVACQSVAVSVERAESLATVASAFPSLCVCVASLPLSLCVTSYIK